MQIKDKGLDKRVIAVTHAVKLRTCPTVCDKMRNKIWQIDAGGYTEL